MKDPQNESLRSFAEGVRALCHRLFTGSRQRRKREHRRKMRLPLAGEDLHERLTLAALDFIVLATVYDLARVLEREVSNYEVIREVAQGRSADPSAAEVQLMLSRLERAALVVGCIVPACEAHDGADRKCYRLSAWGKDALAEMKQELDLLTAEL